MSEGALIAGRYEIRQELARGGMGVVYSVLDTSRNRPVALKRLLASAASNKHLSTLFQREYHTLVQLQHPRIIEVYDYGVDDDGAYYTMELLDGQDLRELAPLDYKESCRHLRDVASSLALIHARRLVHRDLSARNVRLTSDGRAKLLDFGALATFGVSGHIVGTPPVVPPEALSGQPLDQRADLYALGALAYWLLTGRHAYPAQSLQALPSVWRNGAPVPPSAIAQDVPRDLDQLIMSLLNLDSMSRPSSAAEVIERLNVIAGLPSEEVLDVGHSYLSNPNLVGRDRELERLRRSLERVTGGHSASVIIEGEPGIGKTRLVEEMAVEAQLSGAIVLRVDAEVKRGAYAAVRGLASALLMAAPDLALDAVSAHVATLAPVIPEIAERFPAPTPSRGAPDKSERRIRVQAALADWFSSVSQGRPLLLIVDNAHAADEASLALCAALPRRAPNRALGIVVTQRTGEDVLAARTLNAIRETSVVVPLAGLSASDSIALVRALFGDVANAGRLGQWLRDRTDGNPMQSFALATQLIADGYIRYKDGAWVLPSELSRAEISSGMATVFERRVAQLSDGARQLVESISIERGTLTIEQCSTLAGINDEELFSSLDELVQREMLVSVDGDYRFSQVALQKHLCDHLPEDRKKELHRRAGEYLLTRAEADPFLRVDAGWHLLRGGDESRGADILAEVGSELIFSIEGTALAAPGLEAALHVFEKQGRSKWILLNVLEALTSAGWYVDRKYAIKYAERSFELAMELSGLRLASKLSPFLGQKWAVKLGTLIAAVRHGAAKKTIEVERFKDFKRVFGPLIASMSIMVGVAANSFDAKTARRLLDTGQIMSAFPADHVVAVMHDYCRYLTYAAEGRIVEAKPIGLRVLDWFQGDEAPKIIGVDGAKALSGGQMTSLGVYTALGGRDEALDWAEKLENIGLSFYRLMATQTRFVYHVMRGEMTRAAPFREQLELNAIQGGTTWQTSILIPMMLGQSYILSGEVVRIRQATEELEAMAFDIPSLENPVKLLRAAYHYRRGRPAEAVPILEELAAVCPPNEHVLWRDIASVRIRALLALRRDEEALALGEQALANSRPEERAGVTVLNLYIGTALARSAVGDSTGAVDLLDQLLVENAPGKNPLALACLHEARAIVAHKVGDTDRVAEHLEKMAEWARSTENTALIARWKSLESQLVAGLEPAPSRRAGLAPVTAYVSAIRTVLEQHHGMDRARAALRLLLENTNSPRGCLYLGTPPHLQLVAQMPDDTPPSQSVAEHVAELAAAVHQSTDFTGHTEGLTGTASVVSMAEERNGYSGDLTAQLLVISQGGQPRVIGAIALKLETGSGQRVGFELLEAVARSLDEIGGRDASGASQLPVSAEA